MNQLKTTLAEAIAARERDLHRAEIEARIAKETVDVTLAPRPTSDGRIHPVSQVAEEIIAIFADMGFVVAEAPTSRTTSTTSPPSTCRPSIRPGKCTIPSTSRPMRMASECSCGPTPRRCRCAPCRPDHRPIGLSRPAGPIAAIQTKPTRRCSIRSRVLAIDRAIHMGHLKGCLETFARTFFEIDSLSMRFRPSYFPFTEPSAEMDIGCARREGEIVIGEGDDWLEISRLRHGQSAGAGARRRRSERVSGIRLRAGDRPRGDAQIRHPRPAGVLRFRPAVASTLRMSHPSMCLAWPTA